MIQFVKILNIFSLFILILSSCRSSVESTQEDRSLYSPSRASNTRSRIYGRSSVPPFRVESISPSEGSVYGGEKVTLLGQGFSSHSIVQVGNVKCAKTPLIHSEKIVCITPEGPLGDTFFSVMESSYDLPIHLPFRFISPRAPEIDSVLFRTSAHSEGNSIVISGRYFKKSYQGKPLLVQLGGELCHHVAVPHAGEIQCVFKRRQPLVDGESITVQIQNPDGQIAVHNQVWLGVLPDALQRSIQPSLSSDSSRPTLIRPTGPSIEKIEPHSGMVSEQGVEIKIIGYLLDSVVSIRVGKNECLQFTRVSSNEVKCTVPVDHSLGFAQLSLITADGKEIDSKVSFDYLPDPYSKDACSQYSEIKASQLLATSDRDIQLSYMDANKNIETYAYENRIDHQNEVLMINPQFVFNDPYLYLHGTDLSQLYPDFLPTDLMAMRDEMIDRMMEMDYPRASLLSSSSLSPSLSEDEIEARKNLKKSLDYHFLNDPSNRPVGFDRATEEEKQKIFKRIKRIYDYKKVNQDYAFVYALANNQLEHRCIEGVRDSLSDIEDKTFGKKMGLPVHVGEFISRVFTDHKMDFINQHKKLFPGSSIDSSLNNIHHEFRTGMIQSLRRKMTYAFSLRGVPPEIMFRAYSLDNELRLSPESIMERFMKGGSLAPYGEYNYSYDFIQNHSAFYINSSASPGDFVGFEPFNVNSAVDLLQKSRLKWLGVQTNNQIDYPEASGEMFTDKNLTLALKDHSDELYTAFEDFQEALDTLKEVETEIQELGPQVEVSEELKNRLLEAQGAVFDNQYFLPQLTESEHGNENFLLKRDFWIYLLKEYRYVLVVE